MAKRVYYAYHPESDCVLKTHNYDEHGGWIMYDQCDNIFHAEYTRIKKEIEDGTPIQDIA